MAGIEFIEAAIDLLSCPFDLRSGRDPKVPPLEEDDSPLTSREEAIVEALQQRRSIPRGTAEDLVRWLRSQGEGQSK